MTKKLKELLESCIIQSKWLNMGTWQKDEFTNLLTMCERENIIIKRQKKKDYVVLRVSYDYGNMKVVRYSNFENIERDLVNLFAQKCLYLGDKFKIFHRLRDYNN